MAGFVKVSAYLFWTFCVTEAAYQLYRCLFQPKRKNTDVVLFFPDNELTCPDFWRYRGTDAEDCGNSSCRFSHKKTSVSEIMCFMRSARKRLDLCMYLISHTFLVDVILDVHKSGVHVRVITDEEGFDNQEIQISRLRKAGIAVHSERNESVLMHHKFGIVDDCVVLTGSLNWTRHAVTGNMENVLITQVPHLVRPYRNEFKRLWKHYEELAKKRSTQMGCGEDDRKNSGAS